VTRAEAFNEVLRLIRELDCYHTELVEAILRYANTPAPAP